VSASTLVPQLEAYALTSSLDSTVQPASWHSWYLCRLLQKYNEGSVLVPERIVEAPPRVIAHNFALRVLARFIFADNVAAVDTFYAG
jgi:hypothetical protein